MNESQEINNIIGHAGAGIKGYFEVELIHKPTGTVKQKLQFPNVITDAAIDLIGSGNGSIRSYTWAAVGTGTATPTTTDTTLSAQLVRTNSAGSPSIAGSSFYDTVGIYWRRRITRVFLSGVGTGNLTEVGLFNASSGGTMLCRQLFRDNAGNPTTIVKTADDELRITYEFRIYPQQTSNTTTLTIKGVSTTCTTRAYDIDSSNRWGAADGGDTAGLVNSLGDTWGTGFGDVTGVHAYTASAMPTLTNIQTGTFFAPSTVAWGSYTNGTYYKDQTVTFLPGLGERSIGSIVWGYVSFTQPAFITTFNPPISKTATERAIFTGRFSWGRGSGSI